LYTSIELNVFAQSLLMLLAASMLMLSAATTASPKPNLVYILCDDMNELLGDEAIITQTKSLLADQGARAANAFVSSPKCTPSRSAWLSGRYYHNLRPNGATTGKGLNTTHFFDTDAIFPTLHRNGYKTAVFGKIHNNQAEWLCSKENHTEPFTHIETECSPCGNYFPASFVVKSNDAVHTSMETFSHHTATSNYSHAQYGNRSAAFIKQTAAAGDPFFVFVGTTGPHLPAIPAPWHQAIADNMNITAPRSPNFNKLGVDHFDLLSTHPPLTDALVADVDHLMKQRWGVLLSIDDLVAGLHKAVVDAGVVDNTYFFYSSDHGYHLGQFRIPIEKMLPYETDIRIPLFIKGPGIAPGTVLNEMVANIDVAPTLLDLAGIPIPTIMDGMSLKPLLISSAGGAGKTDTSPSTKTAPPGWRTRFASEFAEGGIQHYGPFQGAAGLYDNPDNQWRMLRVINTTHNLAYTEFDKDYIFETIQFHELYDTKADPWQQHNLWNSTPPAIQAALHAELVNMFSCTGTRTAVSNCHARSASPLLPPAPTPPPAPPSPPSPPPSPSPSPPSPPSTPCNSLSKGVVLKNTDIGGGDIISPCQLVAFPGTYAGAQQCAAMCSTHDKANGGQCVGWTFHHKKTDNPRQWRCCIKDSLQRCTVQTADVMWSGILA